MYGKQVLEAIQNFRQGQRADEGWRAKPSRPAEETLKLLEEGRTFVEIAQIRQRTLRAVVSLVVRLDRKRRRRISAQLAARGTLQPDRRRLPTTGNGPPEAPQRSPPARNPLRRDSPRHSPPPRELIPDKVPTRKTGAERL